MFLHSKKARIVLSVAAVVAVVVAAVEAGARTSGAQPSRPSRVIQLSAVNPDGDARGSVLVFAQTPSMDYHVNRLNALNRFLGPGEQGEDIYAIYLKVGDATFRRLQSFNTDATGGNHHSGVFLSGLTPEEEEALFSEPLVVEVRHDNLVVLLGEDPAT